MQTINKYQELPHATMSYLVVDNKDNQAAPSQCRSTVLNSKSLQLADLETKKKQMTVDTLTSLNV